MSDQSLELRIQGECRSRRGFLVFLAFYACFLLFFVGRKPLILDEILDLVGVRNASLSAVLDFVPTNAGGVPLGYLSDFAAIRLFGYSPFAVRFPSVIFTLAACVGVFLLAREADLRRPLWAVIFFAISPLPFAYGMIARPYAQAICWSIFATVVFFKLIRARVAAKWAILYGGLIAAGLYTQPYSVFIPLAHLVWLAWDPWSREKWRSAVLAGAAFVAACLAFLPWYVKSQAGWKNSVGAGPGPYQPDGIKGMLLLAHEITGAGYWGTGLVIIGVIVAYRSFSFPPRQRRFWVLCIACPVLCVLLTNLAFGYFFAIRQFLFILPPVAILMVAAMESGTGTDPRKWILLAPACLAAAMIYQDARHLVKPGEEWETAATVLRQQTTTAGACTLFVPPDARDTFIFFQPSIAGSDCAPSNLSASDTIIVAIRSLGPGRFYAEADDKLAKAGFSKTQSLRAGEPRLDVYRRTPAAPER